ncbi:transcription elongation factor spt5-like [Lingula anatina]|uniref:Transcription elongation factor spt5-like n=1 Tax=Lingula anatina TaxID=7574 RepID=A0A1S3IP05_LINAN|nr:transcription elongation factor spt5-like [Lingula anatina]|eukprot:XP_013399626.1 transcription elongation factor spt5-like [Lingula anatina]
MKISLFVVALCLFAVRGGVAEDDDGGAAAEKTGGLDSVQALKDLLTRLSSDSDEETSEEVDKDWRDDELDDTNDGARGDEGDEFLDEEDDVDDEEGNYGDDEEDDGIWEEGDGELADLSDPSVDVDTRRACKMVCRNYPRSFRVKKRCGNLYTAKKGSLQTCGRLRPSYYRGSVFYRYYVSIGKYKAKCLKNGRYGLCKSRSPKTFFNITDYYVLI